MLYTCILIQHNSNSYWATKSARKTLLIEMLRSNQT